MSDTSNSQSQSEVSTCQNGDNKIGQLPNGRRVRHEVSIRKSDDGITWISIKTRPVEDDEKEVIINQKKPSQKLGHDPYYWSGKDFD